MRAFLFLLLSGFSIGLMAQESSRLDSVFSTQMIGGLNFYRAELEGEMLRPLPRPFFGIDLERKTKGKLTYAFGLQYYVRAASYSPSVKLEEKGLAVFFGPRYKLGDLSFFINGALSSANSQKYDNQSSTGFYEPLPELANISTLRAQFGAEVKLLRDLNLFVSRSMVLDESGTFTNLFGLRYSINDRPKPPTPRQRRKSASSRQIMELSEGVLLVRLNNPTRSIEAMRKVGRDAKANKLESRIDEQNALIRRAFASEYTFSKVYFFYSQHSDSVRQGKLNGILYDEDYNLVRSLKGIDSLNIFTAEFGEVGQDTNRYFDHQSFENGDTAFSNVLKNSFYGGTKISFDALVISDQNFNQLERPFPYYSRWIRPAFRKHPEQILFLSPIIVFLNWEIEKSVKRLNRRLERYHDKQTQD